MSINMQRNQELREKHKMHAEHYNVHVNPIATHIVTGVRNVLEYGDIARKESELMLPHPVLRGVAERTLAQMIRLDPECSGMTPAGNLVELFEQYVFTNKFYNTPRSNGAIRKHIRNRATLLVSKLLPVIKLARETHTNPQVKSSKIRMNFPDVMRAMIKVHEAKIMIADEAKIKEHVGVVASDLDDSLFADGVETKERALGRLILYQYITNAPQVQNDLPVLRTLVDDYLLNLNSRSSSMGIDAVGKGIASIITQYKNTEQQAYEKAQSKLVAYKAEKQFQDDSVMQADEKFKNLSEAVKNLEAKVQKAQHIEMLIANPPLTLKNYKEKIQVSYIINGTDIFSATGLQFKEFDQHGTYVGTHDVDGAAVNADIIPTGKQSEIASQIVPAISEYHQEVVDEYFKEVFGTTAEEVEQNKETEFYPAMEADARGAGHSKFIQSGEEASHILEYEKDLTAKFVPGAWFKFVDMNEPDPEKALALHRIVRNDGQWVFFEGSEYPMSQKELVQFLMNPNYGKSQNKNYQIDFLHDGQKEPINSRKELEKKLGLRAAKDNSSTAFIKAGDLVMAYDSVNKKNVTKGRVFAVDGDGIVMDEGGKAGKKIPFERFFMRLKAQNWRLETNPSNFDTLESIEPSAGAGRVRMSLASLYSHLKYKVTSYIDKWTNTFKIWELEDMVNGAVMGSDDYKAKVGKLMEQEKKEVEDKVKEINEEYNKGGKKRKGLEKFMENPPDVRTFKGRVLAKAWLQVTLSNFGTLYPSPSIAKRFERQRFWLRLFSVSSQPNDPTKFPNAIAEAIDNASKVVGSTDARVELTTLTTLVEQGKFTHPCMAGSMGKGFKSEITSWESTGKEGMAKAKLETIAKATVPEIYKVITETIENQEWPSLKDIFEKLAGKGYGAQEMFHLFLFTIDQAHYVENGIHRMKVPMKELTALGKSIAGNFPLPFFTIFTSEESVTNFCHMIYSNAHVKNKLKWTAGKWGRITQGDYTYIAPHQDNTDLYKFFLAVDGDYTMLRGISQDYRKSQKLPFAYNKEEEDFMKFRGMYEKLMGGYTVMKASENVDKNNWNHMPLLTLHDKYFSALYRGSGPLEGGDWGSEEVQMYFESLMKEYKGAMSSDLPQKDKIELQRRVGEFIWKHFFANFKYNESQNQADRQAMILQPDKNRSYFTKHYGKMLSQLGFSHYSLAKKFSEDTFIYPSGDPNMPIIPSGNSRTGKDNFEYYKRLQDQNSGRLKRVKLIEHQ